MYEQGSLPPLPRTVPRFPAGRCSGRTATRADDAGMKHVIALTLLLGLTVGRTHYVRAACVEADREGYCVVETDNPDAGGEGVVEAEE